MELHFLLGRETESSELEKKAYKQIGNEIGSNEIELKTPNKLENWEI